MLINAAPWIKQAARIGCRPLAVLIARRLVRHDQIVRIPMAAIHASLPPEIARRILRRMHIAGLIEYRIRSQWIEIAACTEYDVF